MKLEEQVTSLELSKRLKELGVKQESYFWWVEYKEGWRITPIGKHGGFVGMMIQQAKGDGRVIPKDCVSAFTVAELGDRLLVAFHSGKNNAGYVCTLIPGWERRYSWDNRDLWEITQSETEADARAKTLICLLEKNLITAKEIGGSLISTAD